MAAFVVMLSRLLSTCQQSSASGRYSNRSSALRTHERRGSATITSSDVEKTRLGKLSDDESWSRWNERIERVGALHYLYGARRPARFSRYAVPLRFLAIFECGG